MKYSKAKIKQYKVLVKDTLEVYSQCYATGEWTTDSYTLAHESLTASLELVLAMQERIEELEHQ